MSKTVSLRGEAVRVEGNLPAAGAIAPDFMLTDSKLSEVSLRDFAGRRKVLNIVPSLDTPTCATSTRKFNEAAAALRNTVVLVISGDLPFAAQRFCATEGIERAQHLSCFRHAEFARAWGVALSDGPLAGLTARAVIVLDESNRVLHSELVPEIADEPNYVAALAALQ